VAELVDVPPFEAEVPVDDLDRTVQPEVVEPGLFGGLPARGFRGRLAVLGRLVADFYPDPSGQDASDAGIAEPGAGSVRLHRTLSMTIQNLVEPIQQTAAGWPDLVPINPQASS
jgi:hypothetical protein